MIEYYWGNCYRYQADFRFYLYLY